MNPTRTPQGLHANDTAVLAAMAALFLGTLGYAGVYGGLGLAAGVGLLLLGAGVVVALVSHGRLASQIALPALGMALSGLMIHVARGQTEAHFSVFAFLAVTIVYRHWLPVVAGAATIALHHLSFNYMQAWGWGPVCFTEPGLMRVIEHALFVVVEAAILVVLANRARADFAAGEQLGRLADRLVDASGQVDFTVVHAAELRAPGAQRMLQALQRIESAIAAVRQTATGITVAADEIAAGSQDLSSRTERTASSLQQTASSMAQINDTVRGTADTARSASELASTAAEVAERGGQVVAQVVATMDEINASSKRIADIIGTIDGIAFQTNILALNAAVEAARAGEQGRGFAVVAAEVRTLAQRSATAAKEIRSLIQASVERVDSGSRLVGDAGQTMSRVVGAVGEVRQLIGGVSTTAQGQVQDIGQVTQAVSQLDEVTQQNAAMVEQSAAAVASLRDQARQLEDAVSSFRLAGA